MQQKPELLAFELAGNAELGSLPQHIRQGLWDRSNFLYSQGQVPQLLALMTDERHAMVDFSRTLSDCQAFIANSLDSKVLTKNGYATWQQQGRQQTQRLMQFQSHRLSDPLQSKLPQALFARSKLMMDALGLQLSWRDAKTAQSYHKLLFAFEAMRHFVKTTSSRIATDERYADVFIHYKDNQRYQRFYPLHGQLLDSAQHLLAQANGNKREMQLCHQLICAAMSLSYHVASPTA